MAPRTTLTLALLLLLACSATEPADDTAPEQTSARPVAPKADPRARGPLPRPASAPVPEETLVPAANVPARASRVRPLDGLRAPAERLDREAYGHFDTNPVHLVSEDPVSTFSVDVDTASYSNVRRLLNRGVLPRYDAVRVEELVNYFSYHYPTPHSGAPPFSVYTEIGPSPWHQERHLLHIGIQGYELPEADLPPANLVFLIDVSGSMQSPDKLDLLKPAMKLLASRMSQRDTIAIAVYAGAAGTVLPPTNGAAQAEVHAAIDRLTAGGSTNGGAGIRLAYRLARERFIADGINRIVLATDGDFNVGMTDVEQLKNLVARERESGVALTILGFGSGNYNDALMQEIAQIGNGNAAYIDTLNEARKVLIEEIGSTLNTIAKDVKVQIEFNPRTVQEYRLIGYETRHLDREDFNNDAIDAGDIGAGHTVTALYEIALAGSGGALVDPLRYDTRRPQNGSEELAFLKLRYKLPTATDSRLITRPIGPDQVIGDLMETSDNYRFSAAVAGFGQILRGGEHTGAFDLAAAEQLAATAKGEDAHGYRGEFIGLVRTAQALAGS